MAPSTDQAQTTHRPRRKALLVPIVLIVAFLAMWFSTTQPRSHYDYTKRVASAMLRGKLGLKQEPPPWLNEFVQFNGRYYSVFPLGSVLSVMPLAALQRAELVKPFPTRFLLSALAAGITALSFLMVMRFAVPESKAIIYSFAPMFGTCLWPNLAFGGAWQIALGFAVLGTLGAILCVHPLAPTAAPRFVPRPIVAGFCFAIAFGNRTEVLLTAPLFYYLLSRDCSLNECIRRFAKFSLVPGILGFATLAYNKARFGSPFDFGYARIPGVLEEPWYRDGIFAISAIPRNAYAMLIEPWKFIPDFPWAVPTGWGGSLLISSPFLILILIRVLRGNRNLAATAWTAIAILTLVLWLHGNPGGWQVSYRYASVLFPWALLLLVNGEPRDRSFVGPGLVLVSIAINAYSTWIFTSTKFMGH